jgi:hypothetical protein
MPNLLAEREREALILRLAALTPERQRRWGRMTAHQMVCHVSDQMRVALGDLPAKRFGGVVRGQLARLYAIHTPLPWPRGKIRTSPEMLTAKPAGWDADVRACEALIRRFATERPRSAHPAFGRLSAREWGVLAAKHLAYHFTQFGV